ncbi:hypothetical protein HED60_05425 [Planctomycetales bacterium ZRK34]|nr:hypothetical protein HED60_05425 [Planctomycetales bacterium ZRK34]
MNRAVTARQQGDDYQAYLFWMTVGDMLQPTAKISEVGYEVDLYTSLDDIAIRFSQPRIHGNSIQIDANFIQVKYSVDYGHPLTWRGLMDPGLINATQYSFLQRLQNAVRTMQDNAKSHLFTLYSPWAIPPDDPLAELINTTDGSINFDKLFKGKSELSKMGEVRYAWREHLGLANDQELIPILERLQIKLCVDDMQTIVSHLNARLSAGGLHPWCDASRVNVYPPLIRKLYAEGRSWFDASTIRDAAKHEGLLVNPTPAHSLGTQLGIRSFNRFAENMEDETDSMLCLTPHFTNRQIKSGDLWAGAILPEVQTFLNTHVKSNGQYVIHIQALSGVVGLLPGQVDAHRRDGRSGSLDLAQSSPHLQ